ncbi:MAG: filamentous hemagglutinin N-terminal domain-containing protein, partial [Coleofasciculaceae cyanobacterium]
MNLRRLLPIVSVVLSLSPMAQVKAQLSPDNSLGAESSVVTPLDQLNERIDGGATRGTNLFHSFQDFNVGEGRGVFFGNPTGIENILSRVTGGNASDILGKLGVLGEANLFLVNPNGIHFGENASLEISGSFLATTADGIRLGENGLFSAKQLAGSQLLSVEPGALFSNALAAQQAGISNAGQLVVGKDLTLAAGNLDLQGQLHAGANLNLLAENTVRVRDSQVSPFLASAGEQLLLQGNRAVDIFALNHANSGFFSLGNMVFRSASAVGGDAHYWSGGNFGIEQLDGTLGNLFSPYDPVIRSQGDVSFNGYQGTSLHILAAGSVSIGTAVITGPETGAVGVDYLQENIQLSDGTEVSIDGSVRPTLDVRAGMRAEAVGIPGITGSSGFPIDVFANAAFNDLEQPQITATPTSADITIGDVSFTNANGAVSNGLVLLTNQYQPNTALPGGNISITGNGFFALGINAPGLGGPGGEVFIDARNDLSLVNGADIRVRGAGGGGIKINATNLETSPGSVLVAGIRQGQGSPTAQAGDIEITTTGAVNMTESVIANQVGQGAEGWGGDIV